MLTRVGKQRVIAAGLLVLLALLFLSWTDTPQPPDGPSRGGTSAGGNPELEGGAVRVSAVDPAASAAADADAGEAEGPSLLILGPDEKPVEGLDVTIASYEVSPVLEAATDERGVVRIPAPWADTLCVVSVVSDEWVLAGESLFPARGQSVVRAERGCVVWIRIPPGCDHLIGSPCGFSIDNGTFRSIAVAGRETRAGAFFGGMLRLHSIANVHARSGTERFLLPRAGTVTVDFVQEEGPHSRLMIRGPRGGAGTAWFRFVESRNGSAVAQEFSRPSAVGTTEVPLDSGTYAYLGRWGNQVSEGHVTVSAGAHPTTLLPRWRAGVSLEVRTADQAFVKKANLHIRPQAWKTSMFGESGRFAPGTAGDTPGRIVVADSKVPAHWRHWPGEAVLDADVVRWHGLPPGATCDVRVETLDWTGHLATLPLPIVGRAEHQIDAPHRFVVHVEAGGKSADARVLIMTPPNGLHPSLLASGGTINGQSTVLLDGPTLHRRNRLRIEASSDAGKGVTEWRVGEREVTVRLGEVPSARFAVRVVTAEGQRVPSVMISFGRVGWANRFVLTGPEGVASVRLPADATVYTGVNGTRYANDGMPTAKADAEVTLVVRPLFKLLVENGTGAAFRGTVRVVAGPVARRVGPAVRQEVPTTILDGGVLEKRLLRAGDYTVTVERWSTPGERESVFSKRVRVGDEDVTRVVFR